MRMSELVDDVAQQDGIFDEEDTFGGNGDDQDQRADAILNSESEMDWN